MVRSCRASHIDKAPEFAYRSMPARAVRSVLDDEGKASTGVTVNDRSVEPSLSANALAVNRRAEPFSGNFTCWLRTADAHRPVSEALEWATGDAGRRGAPPVWPAAWEELTRAGFDAESINAVPS